MTRNKDGLALCPKCNTPCEFFVEPKTILPCMCKCRKEQHEKEEREMEELQRLSWIIMERDSALKNKITHTYTFEADDRRGSQASLICQKYVAKFDQLKEQGRGLILWGQPGSGKTFLACAILNALIDQSRKGFKMMTLSDVVRTAQDFNNAEARFRILMQSKLILIDDLGTERGSTFAHEAIYRFIDGCYTNQIPLIVTTNYTPSILKAAAEDTTDVVYARIFSRILERCYPIKLSEIKRRVELSEVTKKEMDALFKEDA